MTPPTTITSATKSGKPRVSVSTIPLRPYRWWEYKPMQAEAPGELLPTSIGCERACC